MQLKVDNEFKSLIPPLTNEEYAQLKKNVISEGCRDALIAWQGTIIDGHNRYEICQKHGIPFKTAEMDFDNREKAKEWIILNQFGRRNLSAYDRSILALKLKELFADKAKENQLSTLKQNTVPKKSWEREEKEEIAKIWDDNAYNYDTKVRAIDNIKLKYGKLRGREEKRVNNKVYIAKSGDRLKIGSSVEPESRIEQLRVACPDIILVFQLQAGTTIEKKAHKRFEQYSVGGEWFKYSETILSEIVAYIKRESDRGEETDVKLAAMAGVSHDTIAKVQKIEEKASEPLKEKIKSGEVSINQAYQSVRRLEKLKAVEEKIVPKDTETKSIDIFKTDQKYAIIYADPPWSYYEGGFKNQSLHYKTMTIEDICNLPVKNIADTDCILFLWVTFPILQECFKVIEAWGFKYSTAGFVWVKKNKSGEGHFFGCGNWTRANSELCLIATKGSVLRLDASISQVIESPVEEHSKKPAVTRELITKLVGELPRIELFSRQTVDGWDSWGE